VVTHQGDRPTSAFHNIHHTRNTDYGDVRGGVDINGKPRGVV
jgi:hypothetical protein